jgi:hypothetical protein
VIQALTARALAQDAPPKNREQQPPVPPVAPADTPKGQTPAPPVAPQEPPKAETPAPPFDTPKKESSAPADLQKQAPPGQTDAQPDAMDDVDALSLRYRFIERYSIIPDPARPDLKSQYRVAVAETAKMMRDVPQRAPENSETKRLTIYTEAVAGVDRIGAATQTVRRYDDVSTRGVLAIQAMKPPFLQGLTILYQRRPREQPDVMSLTSDRRLREEEYMVIAQEVFMPQLAELLPRTALRVNDKYEIPRDTAHRLWAQEPDSADYELIGTLVKISKADSGKSMVAVFEIKGQFTVLAGPSAFNSRIFFTFDPPKAGSPAAGTTEKSKDVGGVASAPGIGTRRGVIEARGWITRAMMSQVVVGLEPSGSGRLKVTTTRELDVHRATMEEAEAMTKKPVDPVVIPNPLPLADQTNSWLVYRDPAGRFEFQHPEQLEIVSADPALGVELKTSRRTGGDDALLIFLRPRSEDANGLTAFVDPAQLERIVDARWERGKESIQTKSARGPAGWLRQFERDTPPRKVYRIESAVDIPDTPQGPGKRIYTDDYLVELGPSRKLMFESMTERDDHVAFRTQVEAIIRSFRFLEVPGRSSAGTTPAAATPARPR